MAYIYDAVDCPAPIALTVLRKRSDVTPLAAKSFSPGESMGVSNKLNQNAVYLDQLSAIGGANCCCVGNGLDITPDSGLSLTVSAGLAFLGGAVEVSSDQTVILSPSSEQFVWVKTDGTIVCTTTKTAPVSIACYIGRVSVGSSAVTAGPDYSGVIYLRGGHLFRGTGDSTVPGDTPSSSLILYTKTNGGFYCWDGTDYDVIYPVSTGVPVDGLTIDYNGSGELEVIDVPVALITGVLPADQVATDGSTIQANGSNELEVIVAGLTGIADSQLASAYIKADGTRAMAAALSLGGFKVTNVADPSSAQDAATKAYVDAIATGLVLKASCRCATAAALAANTFAANALTATSNGALTVDGVSVAVSNRVLVKNEATGANNGIYTVTQVGDGSHPYILTRATDADTSAEVTSGMFTFISEGTVNGTTAWALSTANPITLNTTALTFVQFYGAGAYTAGAGLTLTGSQFSAHVDGSTVQLGGGGDLQVGQISAAKVTSGTLPVARGGTGLGSLGAAYQVARVNAGETALEYYTPAAGSGYSWIKEAFTGDGATTGFTLSHAPATGLEMIYMEGLLQIEGGVDYTLSGTSLTFATAPPSGARIRAFYPY